MGRRVYLAAGRARRLAETAADDYRNDVFVSYFPGGGASGRCVERHFDPARPGGSWPGPMDWDREAHPTRGARGDAQAPPAPVSPYSTRSPSRAASATRRSEGSVKRTATAPPSFARTSCCRASRPPPPISATAGVGLGPISSQPQRAA